MASLREFWFPILLFVAGIPFALVGLTTTENGRRVCFTVAATFTFVAVLSYIWGDPVRGPFAHMVHPGDKQTFFFKAGGSCRFPISQLKDGIDFSRCMFFEGQIQPIELWVRKTWWSGLQVKTTLKDSNGQPIVTFDDKTIQNGEGIDVNYDDYAFEMVGPTKAPIFQLVIAKDYGSMYLNARLIGGNDVLILKDDSMYSVSPEQAKQPENNLDRIFKYPSYVHQGERD